MWKAIDIEYLGRYGIPLPPNLQQEIEGRSFSETAVYFKERFGLPDTIEQMKADWNSMAWDKYTHEVPLKPGVRDFLEKCKKYKIKLGIATSNSRELVENVLGVHQIKDYFHCIMTGCDVAKGKPAPDIYLAVAQNLEEKPEHCLVFEDIIPGLQAGISAGMHTCAVEDEYSISEIDQKKAMADYYIADYNEIPFI
ncbi:MAG: HAD family phosphatase, partial [Lachnospiraceae bacterium]|nr:HAD family phosphatase [Lachnospiraceae bacterium]